MADLPNLLLASLNPTSRKLAEQNLQSLSTQPGFLAHLLGLILDQSQQVAVRLAGSVYLKNVAKMRWEEEDAPIAEADKAALRGQLVPAMLALAAAADRPIRAQIAESVSLIAELDFPTRWPSLIDQLVVSLSPTDYTANYSVLLTAHSIFRPWRSHVRSDALFTDINLVFTSFMAPFLALFRQSASILITSPPSNPNDLRLITTTMIQLVEIFHDFTCQDLPPDIEDAHAEFFAPEQGWWIRFLTWDPEVLRGDADDTVASPTAQLKTAILEILELYIKLYPDQLSKSPTSIPAYVQGVWALVGSNNLPGVANDTLVSQSLRFLSTAIKSGYYKDLFGSRDTISSLVQGVVVPNVALREHELEQLEDDPLEYIRRDLSLTSLSPSSAALSSTEGVTRRQAASDVLQALVSSGYESETTEIVGEWIQRGLAEYANQKGSEEAWKAKDSAVFLVMAVAARGGSTQHGVMATNALVDVVQFFTDHVFQDLQVENKDVHPVLRVDAIRFLCVFRNQLTKPQLLSVLPLLVSHLNSETYVIYTYAAITIERVLFIRQGTQMLFAQGDIHDIAAPLLDALLCKVEQAGSPEKMAENEHLMKCAMRVIVTARQTLTPVYERTLSRLVTILGIISKNPSNPNFDQYIFESISGLMRFVVSGSPETLPVFEQALFGPFTIIIQQDIDQYIPYVYQVLAQMLSLHRTDVPGAYRTLVPFLLTPAVWQQKGSIPGLVKLLSAFLDKDAGEMMRMNWVQSVLAVVQQRLVPSKINDAWGFELLKAVVRNVDPGALKQYFKAVIMSLLTRMQTSKTDKYVYQFAYFILYIMAIQVQGLSPDYLIGTIEEVQPQLWAQVLTNFVIPQLGKMAHKDRKVVVVGMTRLLTQSSYMVQEPAVRAWPSAFISLVKLFHEPQYLTSKSSESTTDDGGITQIDYEEQTAGYQVAYSRLAAAETREVDPVGYVRDPQVFLGERMVEMSRGLEKGRVGSLVGSAVQQEQGVGEFVRALVGAGYDFV